jgi:hypothetical protein
MSGGWTRHQVLVAVDGGKASHDGFVSSALPGLAIHRTSDLGWIITHLPSGAAVLAGCPTRAYAESAARQLARAADWTQPMSVLRHRSDLLHLAQSFTVAWSRWTAANTKAAPEAAR